MNVDWSKKPEGATHYCPIRKTWLKKGGHCMWLSWSPFGRISEEVLIGWTFCHPPEDESALIKEQWTGEGLPPDGTTCEHRTGPGMNWSHATVLAHGEKKVFYRDRDGHEWTRPYSDIEFRPIRTPEQIAAEEREAKAKEMYLSVYFAVSEESWDHIPEATRETFRKAIDAGWQRVTP